MSKSLQSPVIKASTSWWLGGLLLLVFLVLGVGTMFLQKQLRQSQESRSQASVPNGIVQIVTSGTQVNSGATSYIDFAINTQNASIRELSLDFDVLLPSSVTTPPSANTSLNFFPHDVTIQSLAPQSSAVGVIATPLPSGQTGWRVSLVATPTSLSSGYSSNTAQPLFRLEFPMPVTTGQLQVKFASTSSHAFAWVEEPSQAAGSNQDILAIIPPLNLEIGQTACSYTYGAWSACQNGQQVRPYTVQPSTCAAPDPASLSQSCLPQCQYTYSGWGSCVNGWQTRTYTQTPASCTWYTTEGVQPLTQSCSPNTSSKDFSTYTYESCWATQSAGASTYVMWNKTKFPNVTKVDVSTSSDFANFANKDVTNATQTLGAEYLVTDGTNFRTTDGKQSLWVFWPGYTYYFRLFYSNGHSQVITYFVPKCAGTSGVSYKMCNEACSNNSECSPNLACVAGQCRRADNSGSTVCATPPDKGLNRACNDYCANDSECGGGLKCWWNRCRSTKNLEDTSCRAPAIKKVVTNYQTPSSTNYVTVGTGIAEAACNGACTTNRGCAANLRCYQGACRLPENVTNTNCLTVAAAAQSSSTPVAVISVTTEPTVVPLVTVTPDEETKNMSALGEVGQWLAGRLGFLIVGLVVAILIILIWPMLRTGLVPVQTSRPMAPLPPRQMPPVSPQPRVTPTPPVSQSVSRMMAPPASSHQSPSGQPPQAQGQPPRPEPPRAV